MKSKRKESTSSGYDERKSKILRAASGLIRRKGFSATRIDDIADAVGLTKAGLYHYIPKKAQLLSAIMEYAFELLNIEVLLPGLAQKDPEKRLRILLERCGHVFLRERDLMLTLFDEFEQLTPREKRRFVPRRKEFFELIKTTLEELKLEGKLRDLEISVAVFSLTAPVMWLPRWHRPRGNLKRDEVVSETVRLGLLSILAESDSNLLETER